MTVKMQKYYNYYDSLGRLQVVHEDATIPMDWTAVPLWNYESNDLPKDTKKSEWKDMYEASDVWNYEPKSLPSTGSFGHSPKDVQIGGDHYKMMTIQPGEFITKNGLGWYEGNAIKYICRHKMKGGEQDLEKAIHYLQLALEEYY